MNSEFSFIYKEKHESLSKNTKRSNRGGKCELNLINKKQIEYGYKFIH